MGVVVFEDRKIDVPSLTRGQIRELKPFGFTYFSCRPTIEQANEAMDGALKMVLSDDDLSYLDARPNKDSFRVWKEILTETYGGGDDEGNLSGTSAGGSTGNGSNTASAAVPEKQTSASA